MYADFNQYIWNFWDDSAIDHRARKVGGTCRIFIPQKINQQQCHRHNAFPVMSTKAGCR